MRVPSAECPFCGAAIVGATREGAKPRSRRRVSRAVWLAWGSAACVALSAAAACTDSTPERFAVSSTADAAVALGGDRDSANEDVDGSDAAVAVACSGTFECGRFSHWTEVFSDVPPDGGYADPDGSHVNDPTVGPLVTCDLATEICVQYSASGCTETHAQFINFDPACEPRAQHEPVSRPSCPTCNTIRLKAKDDDFHYGGSCEQLPDGGGVVLKYYQANGCGGCYGCPPARPERLAVG